MLSKVDVIAFGSSWKYIDRGSVLFVLGSEGRYIQIYCTYVHDTLDMLTSYE